MNIVEDYDGIYDVTQNKKQLESQLYALENHIATEGMSQAAYAVGTAIHPELFSEMNARAVTANPSHTNQSVAIEAINAALNFSIGVNVTESDGVITISGIPSSAIIHQIRKAWKTSRISNNIFIDNGMRWISFYSFFAIEVAYMIAELIEIPRTNNKSVLKSIQARMYENTWLKGTLEEQPLGLDLSKLNALNLKLLPSQTDFLTHYNLNVKRFNLSGYLLAAPPGTGKTIAGYALSLSLDSDVTIIVPPKNAVDEVWVATIEERFKKKEKYWTSLMDGMPKGDERYLIIHYEYLVKILDYVKRFQGKKVNVWLDESHNFNETTSIRSGYFVELCVNSGSMSNVWASGTPLKAIGKEAVPLLRSIDPLFTPEVEKRFIKIFGASKGNALDILKNRLGISMYKVPKLDVVSNDVTNVDHLVEFKGSKHFTLDAIKVDIKNFIDERVLYYKEHMPAIEKAYHNLIDVCRKQMTTDKEKVQLTNYLSMTNEMHTKFNPFKHRDAVVWCKQYERKSLYGKLNNSERKHFKTLASAYKYVSLVVRGEALGRILTRRRVECFNAMVEHARLPEIIDSAVKKTLIFTSYVEVTDAINTELKSKGYKPLIVTGATNSDLVGIMKKFRDDPKANPIIATYDSLSTAVPVIEASTCILFNPPFREHIRNQATSRVDRLGQDSPVTLVNVLLDTGEVSNISTRSKDIMEWSKSQIDQMLGTDDSVDIATEGFGSLFKSRRTLPDLGNAIDGLPNDFHYTAPYEEWMRPFIVNDKPNIKDLLTIVKTGLDNNGSGLVDVVGEVKSFDMYLTKGRVGRMLKSSEYPLTLDYPAVITGMLALPNNEYAIKLNVTIDGSSFDEWFLEKGKVEYDRDVVLTKQDLIDLHKELVKIHAVLENKRIPHNERNKYLASNRTPEDTNRLEVINDGLVNGFYGLLKAVDTLVTKA